MYLNLTRFCFSVPYALCIKKIMIKKNFFKSYLPTYTNFFEHVTPNTYYIFWGVRISWPPICIYRPWPPICIYRPWPPPCVYLKFVFTGSARCLSLHLLTLSPQFVFTGPGLRFVCTRAAKLIYPQWYWII